VHRIHTVQTLEPEIEVLLQGRSAHYFTRVLRVGRGESVVLFNGDGFDYAAEVIRAGKKEILIHVRSQLPARAESPLHITLVQAVSRGERMDLSLQKCTELGVVAFQPLLSERVEVRIKPEKLARRMAHWSKVVISACEQSGRAVVPPVYEPLALADWLERGGETPRLVLEPGADTPLVEAKLKGETELVVGPEGGFNHIELDLMRLNGIQSVSLGPRILRTETAGPAAVAILQTLAGDLR
jgi:16S rRNA (uracil1498-N3)-methyltransferase